MYIANRRIGEKLTLSNGVKIKFVRSSGGSVTLSLDKPCEDFSRHKAKKGADIYWIEHHKNMTEK